MLLSIEIRRGEGFFCIQSWLTWTALYINFVNCYKVLASAFLGGELKWHRIRSDKARVFGYSRMLFVSLFWKWKPCCPARSLCDGDCRWEAPAVPGSCQELVQRSLEQSQAFRAGEPQPFSPGQQRHFGKGGGQRQGCFTHQLLRFIVLKGLAEFLEMNSGT